MLAILFSIDIVWLPVIVLFAALAGFALRSEQIRKLKKQVSTLEKEMLNSHAEILQLQEEIVRIQKNENNSKSLVVSMKDVPAEEAKELNKQLGNRRK